ncbi:hypothetical protein B0H17DRAFT_1211589 [Mycena rosella]|uniref:Uncharacterized protein n=1 Tax=Mycena rosella TaxID=1033263 RepID=A0AAD7G3W8_MYCRO|nr:hypothetical protein B0H17DRAFT_1211589 [Mycena rosella]
MVALLRPEWLCCPDHTPASSRRVVLLGIGVSLYDSEGRVHRQPQSRAVFPFVFKSIHYPNEIFTARRGSPLLIGIVNFDDNKITLGGLRAYLPIMRRCRRIVFIASFSERRNQIINGLHTMPAMIKRVLEDNAALQQLAMTIKDNKNLLLMGRGYQYATCLEGALKISYMHSEGVLRSPGPLALTRAPQGSSPASLSTARSRSSTKTCPSSSSRRPALRHAALGVPAPPAHASSPRPSARHAKEAGQEYASLSEEKEACIGLFCRFDIISSYLRPYKRRSQAAKNKMEYEAARRLYEDGSVRYGSSINFSILSGSPAFPAIKIESESKSEGFATDNGHGPRRIEHLPPDILPALSTPKVEEPAGPVKLVTAWKHERQAEPWRARCGGDSRAMAHIYGMGKEIWCARGFLVGTGDLGRRTLAAKVFPDVQIPLIFSYVATDTIYAFFVLATAEERD